MMLQMVLTRAMKPRIIDRGAKSVSACFSADAGAGLSFQLTDEQVAMPAASATHSHSLGFCAAQMRPCNLLILAFFFLLCQNAFKEVARQFAQTEIIPVAAAYDRSMKVPPWKQRRLTR